MLCKYETLGFLRGVRCHEVAEPLGCRVDHLDLTLGDASDEQVVLEPHSDDGVPAHDHNIAALGDKVAAS